MLMLSALGHQYNLCVWLSGYAQSGLLPLAVSYCSHFSIHHSTNS